MATRPSTRLLRQGVAWVAFGCLAAAGCTTNSPGHAGYESRAATAAERMVSPVATGSLLAQLGGEGKLLGPYAKTATTSLLDESEEVASTFSHVQPPDRASQRLGRRLRALLTTATSELQDLRIAARKGDLGALAKFESPLHRLANRLERFQHAHGA